MSVVGSISIKDNASATFRSIRNEQTSFRKDVEKTKNELKATWDKKYQAKLDSTVAAKAAKQLKTKLDPLRKKVVTAVALKDIATDKVKKVTKKVKEVGSMVAKPVVSVVVKGAQALSSVGKAVASTAKVAAAGLAVVGAIGATALTSIYSGAEDAAKAQIEAETKLEAVLGNVASIQERGAGAVQAAKEELMGVASQLQNVGVIGDEVTLAGMQQLATYQLSEKEISTLATGMTDLLAQQKGLNATQEDAVSIGNMIGKAMTGQASALSRVGIIFNDAQKAMLETGTAEERAAVLAEILEQNVGGVNAALAETDQGKIQQMTNAYADMKEEVGKLTLSMKSKLASVVMKNLPTVQKLGTTMMSAISKFADKAIPIIDNVISSVTPVVEGLLSNIGDVADELIPIVSNIFSGLKNSAATVKPIIAGILTGFQAMQPQLSSFANTVFATVQQVAAAAMPVITNIISTIQTVLPAVLPVLETVISTVGSVISAAAPIISEMVTGIGTVVSTLAPIFSTIFSEIGEKVGSVISFVSERMGFIQEVIGFAAPLIGDIVSTAWSVISPVIDIAISVFKILFSVVQKVFPGIQKVIETVWGVVKPIAEGIGSVVSKIAGWFGNVADAISGSGVPDEDVGTNAEGDNNWKGGLTWVGEKGAELVNLPRGSRILPHKESMAAASGMAGAVSAAKGAVTNVIQNIVAGSSSDSTLNSILELIREIAKKIWTDRDTGGKPGADGVVTMQGHGKSLSISIAKLADEIIVRDEGDIDELADRVAKKVLEVVVNMS